MKRSTLTEAQFLKDVANHRMTTLLDQEVHRHLLFSEPGTGNLHFNITTWPGYLCISGDMGCFVFQRTNDMFRFFRTNPHDWNFNREGGLSINLGYWAEKVQNADRRGGITEWCPDTFREVICEEYLRHFMEQIPDFEEDSAESWDEDCASVLERATETWEELESFVLSEADNEHEAYKQASEFDHNGLSFEDFWDHDLTRFTYEFHWACYAIAWAVQQYDKAKAIATEAQPA